MQTDVANGSACRHIVSYAYPFCVFWLVHVIHLHLRKLLICMIPLHFLFGGRGGVILCNCLPSLVLAQRSSFSVCGKASLVVLNSLNFCWSGKLLISPSNLNESLAGQSILGCRLFSCITLDISCHSLLAYRVSVEKSTDNLM